MCFSIQSFTKQRGTVFFYFQGVIGVFIVVCLQQVYVGLSQSTPQSVWVHVNEGTGRPVQQCDSLMCRNSFLGNNGALWHRGIRYIRLWIHSQYLSERSIHCQFWVFLKLWWQEKIIIHKINISKHIIQSLKRHVTGKQLKYTLEKLTVISSFFAAFAGFGNQI